jgi:hypothetical protein
MVKAAVLVEDAEDSCFRRLLRMLRVATLDKKKRGKKAGGRSNDDNEGSGIVIVDVVAAGKGRRFSKRSSSRRHRWNGRVATAAAVTRTGLTAPRSGYGGGSRSHPQQYRDQYWPPGGVGGAGP